MWGAVSRIRQISSARPMTTDEQAGIRMTRRSNRSVRDISKSNSNMLPPSEGGISFFEQMPVKLLFFGSPDSFYLVPESSEAQARLARLNKKLEEQALNGRRLVSAYVGQMCICPPNKRGENAWKRAQIVDCLDDDAVQVRFFDYGFSDFVSFLDLYEGSPEVWRFPIHVKKCRLWDVSSLEWPDEILNSVRALLKRNKDNLTCLASGSTGGTVIADLGIAKPSDVRGEGPTSIKDILWFLGSPNTTRREEKRVERCQYYEISEELFFNGSTHNGTVLCTDEQGVYYLKLPGHTDVHLKRVDRIRKEMTSFYSSKDGRVGYTIECPRVNQPCGVPPGAGESWSRGRILSVTPGSWTVGVLCVDEGRKLELPVSHVRLLPSRFMEYHTLGVYVSLYGIHPNNNAWTDKDTKRIRSLIHGKTFNVFVDQRSVDIFGIHRITLYESFSDKDVLVNALIIRNGWATSAIQEAKSWQVEYYKSNPSILPIKRDDHNVQSTTVEDMDYISYKIRRIYSPRRIFLSSEDEATAFDKLSVQMSTHYRRTLPDEHLALAVGDHCAAFSSGVWVRGKLVSQVNGSAAKVFLLDQGVTNIIVHENLRVLKEEFLTSKLLPLGNFFHLGNIMPIEGEEWNKDACKCLREMLKSDEQLLGRVLDGPIKYFGKDYSLPISIVIKTEKTLGPFEPSEVTMHDVTSQLITKGFAVLKVDVEIENTKDDVRNTPPLKRTTESKLWILPKLPDTNRIVGTVCYVDEDACMYVITPEAKERLQVMNKMAHRFKTLPRKPHDCYWYEGQVCYARLDWDNNWYRGQVETVGEHGYYYVKLIDYGTKICVTDKDLRKDVILTEIPCLSVQVRVEGIRPKNGCQWKVEDVLAMHKLTVDKEVEVQLDPLAVREWPLAGTVLEAKGKRLDIADLFLYLNVAQRS